MNRYTTLILAVALLFLGSCADLQPVDTDRLTNITFDNWVAKYAPDATPFVNENNETIEGLYIQYHHKAPQVHDSLRLTNLRWFRYNMNAYTLTNKTVSISDSTIAHISGTWRNTTHWVPIYRQFDSLNPGFMCPGLIKVLPTLNIGDKVRVFLSSAESFTGAVNLNDGNRGETVEYPYYPTYLDLEITDVVSNPYANVIDSINNYALHKWDMQPSDTIWDEGIFMKKTVTNTSGDPIGVDSVFSMNVTRFFLDDFLASTTSDSIAKVYDRYNQDDTETVYGTVVASINSTVNNPTLPAIYSIAPRYMRKGETALFLVNPEYTLEGVQGNTTANPAIQPYEPSYYMVKIDTVTVTVDDDLTLD